MMLYYHSWMFYNNFIVILYHFLVLTYWHSAKCQLLFFCMFFTPQKINIKWSPNTVKLFVYFLWTRRLPMGQCSTWGCPEGGTTHHGKYQNHSEPFWCPNTTFQYMNLYLSSISRLLVMSVISSGTLNKLWSPKHITHNTKRHRTLSVRTLRVRELCIHDRDTSPVNNQ